jgi:hypothetical protein
MTPLSANAVENGWERSEQITGRGMIAGLFGPLRQHVTGIEVPEALFAPELSECREAVLEVRPGLLPGCRHSLSSSRAGMERDYASHGPADSCVGSRTGSRPSDPVLLQDYLPRRLPRL